MKEMIIDQIIFASINLPMTTDSWIAIIPNTASIMISSVNIILYIRLSFSFFILAPIIKTTCNSGYRSGSNNCKSTNTSNATTTSGYWTKDNTGNKY